MITLFALLPLSASAQYYDWGQDPASTRWNTVKTSGFKVIYPRGSERQAARYVNLLDALKTPVSFGFEKPVLKRLPVVLHTQNFSSNGMVMLAPRRVEMLTAPTGSLQTTLPWHKQLVAHELRHAVQFNNFNRGVPRVLSWVLGEQVLLTAPLYMPLWAMEGDAVMSETMMTDYGRGVQPSFSIEYRAMLAEGVPRFGRRGGMKPWNKFAVDKYFGGSFRDNMPDHYRVGYQMMSWAWGEYGEVFLNKTTRFAARNPYLAAPFAIGLRKYYKTSTNKMFRATFADLRQYWARESSTENSSKIIETPLTSHTRYESPRWVHLGKPTKLPVRAKDSISFVFALKTDLDRTTRLVLVDANCNETTLCRTGQVNSPLALHDGRVYWSEQRQSMLWEQKVGSAICYYDIKTGRKGTMRGVRNALYPASTPGGLAWVEYDNGQFTIVNKGKHHPVADSIALHGLAAVGDTIYYMALDDSGMWIGASDGEKQWRVSEPTRALIANLAADEVFGNLYFSSSASGKDEAWEFNPATGVQRRISNSRYGSSSPSPMPGGYLMTTYTPKGWLLARQTEEIAPEKLPDRPQERLSPPRPRWEVPSLDTMAIEPTTNHPAKKYRKAAHLFNFHSWAPIYFEPDQVVNEVDINQSLGVTIMSQNALANAYTHVGVGQVNDILGNYTVAHAKFKWLGWAPKIELGASWADRDQVVYNAWTRAMVGKLHDHVQLDGYVYLPLLVSAGAWHSQLMPSVQWQYINARLYEQDGNFKTGINYATAGLSYIAQWWRAHRDFAPRWGVLARVNRTWNPLNDDFGRIWSVRGRLYTPGIGRHHSLKLQGAMQWQHTKRYIMRQKELYPRGASYNGISARRYRALSVDYAMPIAYPDGGINSLLYVSRVRLTPGYDVARLEGFNAQGWRTVSSWGADLTLDFTLLRMPSANVQEAIFSIRKPSDSNRAWFSFGLNVTL